MTGVLNAMVASSARMIVVGVAAPGGGLFGYNGAAGSVTPSTVKGITIDNMVSIGGGGLDFRLGFSSVVAQDFFRYLVIQDSSGNYQIRTSASATFSNPSGTRSSWDWSGSGIWTTSHASRTVEFRF